MKTLSAALFLLALTTLACNKSDDNDNPGGATPAATERTWKTGSTTHTVNNYTQSSETYSAYDKDGNSINFTFSSYPPAAGTFRVVSDTATLGTGQVKVYTASFGSNANTYAATGFDRVDATVSFGLNNKIKIVLPDTWARKTTVATDSMKISANLSPIQ